MKYLVCETVMESGQKVIITWSDGSTSVSTAFHRADEAMYADKQAYYAAHPEQKR